MSRFLLLGHTVMLFARSDAAESNPTGDPSFCDTVECVENALSVRTRFLFADGPGGTGLWSSRASTTSKYSMIGPLECPYGGFVSFHWPGGTHDLVRMKSKAHYDACNFTEAFTLAPLGSFGTEQSYYYECMSPETTEYLSCSVPGHCTAGQKLTVTTSMRAYGVYGADAEPQIHARSLKQVMALLGWPEMERGYQTEAQAEHTLEVIWCLESHAPDSCKDWQEDATESSCIADGVLTAIPLMTSLLCIAIPH